MEAPSSVSTEDEDDFGEPVSDAEANELYNKMLRGEPLNDREQSRFDRTFVGMG